MSCIFLHLIICWLLVFALLLVEVLYSVGPANAKVVIVMSVQYTRQFIPIFVFIQTHSRFSWTQHTLPVAYVAAHHAFPPSRFLVTSLERSQVLFQQSYVVATQSTCFAPAARILVCLPNIIRHTCLSVLCLFQRTNPCLLPCLI